MAAAQAGATPPELHLPPLPVCAEALWGVFLDLNNCRDVGMAISPIKPSEVLAYQRLHGVRFNPWEVDTLAALDRVAMESMRTE